MNELLQVFANRPMTDATQRSHIQTLKKVQSIVKTELPLYEFSGELINTILDNPILSPSYRRKVISLFIIIKTHYNPIDSILADLSAKLKDISVVIADKRVDDFKIEDTTQYEAIKEWINNLIDPRQYVVNYLIFYLNVRNLDLLIRLVPNTFPTDIDTSVNYLVVSEHNIKYIRNVYKTASTYGVKTNIITDIKFVTFCNQLQLNRFLLSDNATSLGKLISRRLYNNMTESDYLHQVITYFKANANKLFEIENNRGSAIRTLLSNYNSDFTNGK